VSSTPVRLLLVVTALLAIAGIGIAAYLTVVHFADQPIVCSGIGDCEKVNSSRYAKLAGIPVAVLGLVSYVAMLVLVLAALVRRDALLAAAAWGIALASFLFSMYLTYLELEVIHAICVWCVSSASVVTVMLVALSASVWIVRDEVMGPPAELEATSEGD
jgi:uncharacterized membrane protein